jgi:hypothetical protein
VRNMKKIMLSGMLTLLALSASVASASEQPAIPQSEPLEVEITQMLDVVATTEQEQVDLETQITDAQNNNDQAMEEQLQAQLEQKEKVQEQMTASMMITAQPEVAAQSGVTQFGQVNLQGMDIETAMMAVQSERAKLLENQLKDQIVAVQNRNQQMSELNTALKQLRVMQETLPRDAKSTTVVQLSNEAIEALQLAGISTPSTKISKAELDAMIINLKSTIDSQSNSLQMDMLRLQSMSNKRNEAFELMSNFMKKMQDSRSSIIGNMR